MRNNKKTPKYVKDEMSEASEYRPQRKTGLTRDEFNQCGVQLNPKQVDLFTGIKRSTLSVVYGPAGTSKTFTSCYAALSLLAEKKIEKIIITKPIQESGENIGFLKGTLEEKLEPYRQSYYTNFCKIVGKKTTDFLFSSEEIKFEPLAYMRGSTYDDCIILLDEAQNCTMKQIMLWSTRLGRDSRAVMMGDTSQYDLKKNDSGYNDFISMIEGMNDINIFKFENDDIVRNKFLIELTNRYDKYRSEKNY